MSEKPKRFVSGMLGWVQTEALLKPDGGVVYVNLDMATHIEHSMTTVGAGTVYFGNLGIPFEDGNFSRVQKAIDDAVRDSD